MHELSIAMAIVDGAVETAAEYPGEHVAVVHLRLGDLSGVVAEALLFSYDLACAGTPLEGSRLEIEEVKVAIFCAECQAERELESTQDFSCPVCRTASGKVVRGRELMIDSLELSDQYAAAIS